MAEPAKPTPSTTRPSLDYLGANGGSASERKLDFEKLRTASNSVASGRTAQTIFRGHSRVDSGQPIRLPPKYLAHTSPAEKSLPGRPSSNFSKATAAKKDAIASVIELESRVGDRMWTDSGKPLELRTVKLATEFVRKCPPESFGPGIFSVDFTADGDVLLDWDDGNEPALTVLVTGQGTVVFSGVYKETDGNRRTNKGNEPWEGSLSAELQQAFQRLMNERAA